MPDLALFQRDFAAAMASAGPASPMAVYRNTSAHGTIEALAANYPTVRRILGDGMFGDLAATFIHVSPPRDPVLATYGARFAGFLEGQQAGRELPYLADVARIDRLYLEALFAADAPPFDSALLRAVDPEGWTHIRLRLHPATRFAWLASPAMTIWLGHAQADDPDEIVVKWTAGGALLARPFATVEARPLDRAGYRLLSEIRAGRSIGDAAISTLKLHPDADVGALFASLAAIGLFASQTR